MGVVHASSASASSELWTVLAGAIALLLATGEARAAKDMPLFNVTAVAGESARLPCDISTPELGDAVLLVLWYREDLGTPVYSVDARERDFSQAERWSNETVFGSRAYFVTDRPPAALAVESVRPRDQATYRCRVDFRFAQTRNSKVNFTVIEPPEDLVIVDEKGNNRTSVVGPYTEGSSLSLSCDVFGGKPAPTVEWYREERLVSNQSSAVGQGRVRAQLTMHGLARADLLTSLRCRASNNDRRPPKEAAVLLDMNLQPLDVRLLGVSQPLSAGRRYDLLCQSSGSRPPARITWWFNGQRSQHSKETTSNDGNTTTSTLSWVASKEDDGRHLSCRAENTAVGGDALEDGAQLRIHYIPEATIQLGTSLNPDNIREGADVYFDCIIIAVPPVFRVEWRHNGRVLGPGAGRGLIVSNQSLVLQSVGRASGGNYSCVGVNAEGAGESKPFHLNVLYAPTCKPNQSRVIGVAKNERANISCEVEANPADVTFRWTFNNSAESLDVAPSRVARAGPVSYVAYTPATELDYGTLLCWASNHIGSQRAPCVFHIIAAGRPDQVHNCSVLNVSTDSLAVRCSEGFNGGLPQSFLLEVREAESQALRANLSAPVAAFAVSSLSPGERYHACVYSYNLKGRSEPVVLTAATIRLPERQLTASVQERPRAPASVLTPALGLVVGVLAAMLVLGGGIALLMRLYCSQRRPRPHAPRRKRDADLGLGLGLGLGGGSKAASPVAPAASAGAASGPYKGCGSPSSKGTLATVDSADSDEKNPDVIPQSQKAECDARAEEASRRRQHVSTIDAGPPAAVGAAPCGLLQQPALHCAAADAAAFSGFCTLRNGLPLRDLAMKHGGELRACALPGAAAGGMATLPRHWPGPASAASAAAAAASVGYSAAGALHHTLYGPMPGAAHHSQPLPMSHQSHPQTPPGASSTGSTGVDEQTNTESSPLVTNKRESTV
ncbi:hemicentin-2-like [Schistocerca cancellata]|uniref:hemicentin-2-like n=1 Tax=Schistocerca cancellata TaxID=274614 RepID=UPI002117759D|nr:hemicentin-2-like [Schistocerca cancellata]